MAATSCCRPKITGMGPTVSQPMYMVAYGFNIVIGIRIKMVPCLPLISCPLDYMVEVRNYTDRDKWVTVIVKIDAPWVTAPFGKYFKLMLCWVIAPDPCINFGPLFIRSTGLADIGMGKYALHAVKPTVRAPSQII